jgi:hypothetical protein
MPQEKMLVNWKDYDGTSICSRKALYFGLPSFSEKRTLKPGRIGKRGTKPRE